MGHRGGEKGLLPTHIIGIIVFAAGHRRAQNGTGGDQEGTRVCRRSQTRQKRQTRGKKAHRRAQHQDLLDVSSTLTQNRLEQEWHCEQGQPSQVPLHMHYSTSAS